MTTDNKTLAVDVLAVMHSALGDLMAAQVAGVDTDTKVPELSASIDVIAELIEACERLQQHPDDLEIQADFCRALARVKGESA